MSENLRSCPLCTATQLRELYVTRDRHYGISGSYRIVVCANCSLMFLNPMYSDQELAALYPSDYYAYQNRFESNRVKELLKKLLCFNITTRDPSFKSPGTFLDVGCGSGWFLEVMRSRGWMTHGVEISEAAARLGRESKNLQIYCGTLHDAKFPSESFDYVRSNHSFEHMSEPNEALDEMYRILKPNGKLFIGVPNVRSLNAQVFKRYWWYLGAPVHPFTYSVKTLSEMLARHKFEVCTVNYNSDYSGILGSFQIWSNRNTSRKSGEGLLINNPVLKLMCQWMAKFEDVLRLGDAIEVTASKAVKKS
jgi:SAM-dependent methyltransferase